MCSTFCEENEDTQPLPVPLLHSATCEPEDNLPIPLMVRRLSQADIDAGWE